MDCNRMSNTYSEFKTISRRAWTERTEEAALALLAHYAESKCATYPTCSKLFREVWPDENPPGFILHPYTHLNTHTVEKAGHGATP